MDGFQIGKDLGELRGDVRQLATAVQQLAQQVAGGDRRGAEIKALSERLDGAMKRIAELEARIKTEA